MRSNWRLNVIPKASHNFREVMASAAWYLFATADEKPCESSDSDVANNLRVDEIHADPAVGAKGDANHDGIRDSQDDEFVELRNHGAQPLCLTGWTLGIVPARAVMFSNWHPIKCRQGAARVRWRYPHRGFW